MSQIPPARDSRTADESLPPVEPPSAGFILQLFIVPAVMVVIIVLVWLMFNWLAHMGSDPQDYVAALRRGNVARWQAAVNLANAMRSNAKLKQDTALAIFPLRRLASSRTFSRSSALALISAFSFS